MSDRIQSLYQEFILKKSKDDRLYGELENPTHTIVANNPLCGDKFTLYLEVEGEKVNNAKFKGYGCAISKASTSVLTEMLIGESLSKSKEFINDFLELIDENSQIQPEEIFQDDQLLAFAAARTFPERKACAGLAWEELKNSID